MKQLRFLFFAFCFSILTDFAFSQRPIPLVSAIQIDSVLVTASNPTRLAHDPIRGNLVYATSGGNVYEVRMQNGLAASDTLLFTVADHGITHPQGMCFRDSILFLSGNSPGPSVGYDTAKLMKGVLQANGTRNWVVVVETQPFLSSNHPFTSVITDPTGDYLYWASGARTMLGEVMNGAIPNYREGPLNSKVYKFPITSEGIVLANDSASIDSSGYVFVRGVRNAYSMAFDGQSELFSIDNSGERDDPEELNWLREGHHYGFPWRMGGNWNPVMQANYVVNNDPMVNHASGGYQQGIFNPDPNFPQPPQGLIFDEPALNFGPDADKYRDSLTGDVHDASDDGLQITSFTAHRSPLGLVIDRDSLLAGNFGGKAFLLSYMPGGDSSGISPISPWGSPGPFVDPCEDMLQLQLGFDSGYDNYTFTCERIIEGFYLPVDAVQVENVIYVLEQRGGGRTNLWKVTFPLRPTSNAENLASNLRDLRLAPNPATNRVLLALQVPKAGTLNLKAYDLQGRIVRDFGAQRIAFGDNQLELNIEGMPAGVYLLAAEMGEWTGNVRLLVQ